MAVFVAATACLCCKFFGGIVYAATFTTPRLLGVNGPCSPAAACVHTHSLMLLGTWTPGTGFVVLCIWAASALTTALLARAKSHPVHRMMFLRVPRPLPPIALWAIAFLVASMPEARSLAPGHNMFGTTLAAMFAFYAQRSHWAARATRR